VRSRTQQRSTSTRGSRVPVVNKNDLATINPALAAQADGSWDPHTTTAGSGKRVGWICVKNPTHRWTAPVVQRNAGTGCPVCANRLIVAGLNDLATTHPELAAAGDGSWDPTTYLSGSHTKVNWICSVDSRHRYLCSINERARGVGCSLCNGKVVVPGINDMATLDPQLASECDGTWDPTKVRQFSNKRVGWVCSTDTSHRWNAQIANRSNGGGCPGCAVSGYDATAPGWLYLISDSDRNLLQIGISNYPDQRLRHHERSGWVTLDLIGPFDGDVCYEWEQAIISFVRSSGVLEPYDIGKFEGFTESWKSSDLPVSTIRELRLRVLNQEHDIR
jgi:hypothetical protein